MIFRRFLALLFIVAMTLAPFGMPAMAQAAGPLSHHGEMVGDRHCDEAPAPADHGKAAAGKNCCAAMCVAVVVPDGVEQRASYHSIRERPASDLDRCGFLAEIATPPPRLA